MKEFLKSTAFKTVLGFVFIVSGIIVYGFSHEEDNIILSTFSFITVPFQKAIKYVSDYATDFSYQFREKESLKEENDSLKTQINTLRELTIEYNDLKRENLRFRKYYDIKQADESLKFVSGYVIGRSSTEYFWDFVVDKGTSDGLSLNDAVLTENGLVGRICKINAHSARVRNILSPEAKIGVINSRTGDSGIISGSAVQAANNLTRMTFIPAQSDMQPGDIVVTSGISGMYPKNLKVGKIKSIEYDNYDSSYYAVIEPFENIKEIKDVFIVSDFKGKGTMDILKNDNN